MQHEVKTSFNSGMSFTSNIEGFSVPLDSSDEHSSHSGPSPKRLMLASLAGCTGIDVVSILNKMKVSFSDFSIDVTASLTEDHPKIYKDVMIVYYIRIDAADQPKMEKAVNLSQEKYCGVSAMFKAFSTVGYRIHFL